MEKNEKDEKLTLCLRYICKMCPRAKKCEQELKEAKLNNIREKIKIIGK